MIWIEACWMGEKFHVRLYFFLVRLYFYVDIFARVIVCLPESFFVIIQQSIQKPMLFCWLFITQGNHFIKKVNYTQQKQFLRFQDTFLDYCITHRSFYKTIQSPWEQESPNFSRNLINKCDTFYQKRKCKIWTWMRNAGSSEFPMRWQRMDSF